MARYFGNTAWNIDFAADSMSSATVLPSACKSSGREGGAVGISAGGVGRSGSSIRTEPV
jgi:hypothetical protein